MMRTAYKSINEYVDDVSTEVVFNRRKSYIAHLTTVSSCVRRCSCSRIVVNTTLAQLANISDLKPSVKRGCGKKKSSLMYGLK